MAHSIHSRLFFDRFWIVVNIKKVALTFIQRLSIKNYLLFIYLFIFLQKSLKTFVECVMGLVDVNVLKREIEEAKPNGALDEVFKK